MGTLIYLHNGTGPEVPATGDPYGNLFVGPSASIKTVIYTSGGITYICESSAGAVVTAAVWRVQKIDASGNITHAGTSASNCAKFDRVATDVATVVALSYF